MSIDDEADRLRAKSEKLEGQLDGIELMLKAADEDIKQLTHERDRLRAEKKELEGQLERLLHKTEVEADYLCPTDMRMLEVINERDRYRALLGEAVTLIKEHGCGNYSLALTQWLRRVEGEAKV